MVVRVDIDGKRSQLVPSSDTHLVRYELTAVVAACGTRWNLLVVRVDMGTSSHVYEFTSIVWQYMSTRTIIWYLPGYELTSNGGTSWNYLWYKLTSIGGTIWHGYKLIWVRVDMGTSWPVFVQSMPMKSWWNESSQNGYSTIYVEDSKERYRHVNTLCLLSILGNLNLQNVVPY